ncbi:MAG: NusG domain II-containing protein [Lachnospiraceae bacterium]|nr:NusG domain II-containing protein [Lachnospiraceae bacterium]
MNKRFGKNDILFLTILALCCIGITIAVYAGGAIKGEYITITVDGQEYGTYSLLKNQIISIGESTTNIIEIREGKAYMVEASCPDQLCVKQKEISFDKQSIICLPNKIVVTVTSNRESELDGVVN